MKTFSQLLLMLFLMTLKNNAALGMTVSTLKLKPKLVVLVVIDQFRADYLYRYSNQFIKNNTTENKLGGFNYLTENGAWYPHAKFNLLQNMTGPGHASMMTGAYPYHTGIPINDWYDINNKRGVYCTGDSQYQWLSGDTSKSVGTSPKLLLSSTLGDELKSISPKSQVVSISQKDRSAILMGGHSATTAIWMDPMRYVWTSTNFYFPDGNLPPWVSTLNKDLKARKDTQLSPFLRSFGFTSFPENLKWGEKASSNTPSGLWLTEWAAEKAIESLSLGKSNNTDILALSFSSHDYVGHTYGPTGQSIEEVSLADDKVLSALFNFLQKKIPGGMKNVLIVLTADHGVAPNPELSRMNRLDGGRVDENQIKSGLNKFLNEKFGAIEGDWVLAIREMNLYLNPVAKLKKADKFLEAELEIKNYLRNYPGIAEVFSERDYYANSLPPGIYKQQILNSYHPGRSGDIVAILKPFYISSDDTASHQTGYSYDSTIPIILSGAQIRTGVYAQAAEPIDIAPTLAFLLGTVPPSHSQGRVLSEALGR